MKSLDCCCEMDKELSSWRNRLHEVTEKFDHEPSINKYRLQPHIEGIHILQTEIDDRLEELRGVCKFEGPDVELKSTLKDDEVYNYLEMGCC